MSDAINKPAHYNQGPIECIDAMKIVLTPEEFRGYLKGNVFKYLWREKDKNGNEDIRKGKSYYDLLIELVDESEPEQPKAPLATDRIPEGYRKLNDASEEPRQLGDLRWSVAAKRYVEISVDEIGYANRDNWSACRKIETNEPPDGWRWLELGEVMRNGDTDRSMEPIPKDWIGSVCRHKNNVRRRNKFEVGEKVVHVPSNDILEVVEVAGDVKVADIRGSVSRYYPEVLAPYIEDAK